MKTSNKSKIIAALGAITCLAPVLVQAQPPPAAPSSERGWSRGTQAIRVADTSNLPGENVNDYLGKKITGSQQEELGTIKDFLLDSGSGRIAFIVATAGEAADQLRLLPPNSLQSSSLAEDLTAQIDKAAFDALPTMSEQDLESGNLPTNIPVATNDRWGRRGQLLRASQLTSKLVMSSGQEAGAIDEVGIDLQNGTASLLFRTNSEFAGAQSSFEVPLTRLEFGEGGQVSTRLTRADFAQIPGSNISPGEAQVSTTTPTTPAATPPTRGIWPGTALSPTGRDSGPPVEATNNAAAAIRSAIAADPNLVRENISVHAAGQKVMLRGRASSETVKSQIETLARTHAGDVAVDNNIRVDR